MTDKTLRQAAQRLVDTVSPGSMHFISGFRDAIRGLRDALTESADLKCAGCGGDFDAGPPYVFCDECLPIELPGTPPWPKSPSADAPEGPEVTNAMVDRACRALQQVWGKDDPLAASTKTEITTILRAAFQGVDAAHRQKEEG